MSELIVPKHKLETHFAKILEVLKKHGTSQSDPKMDISWQLNPVVAGISGGKLCEYVERNRGKRTSVFPAWRLRDDNYVWLGYREEWFSEKPAGRTMRFSFRSIGITVHYGEIGATNKPQMFRAEWAGRANWFGSGVVFQAEGAGHPHWQFDALDSIKFEQDNYEALSLLESIRSFSDEESPQEFSFDSTTAARTSVREIGNDISKIHFASAAAFWKTGEAHAHQPNNISELSVWLDKTLDYISKECGR